MRLRVEITVDIEAKDFVEAAEHQKVLEAYQAQLRSDYPATNMVIKERRMQRLTPQKPAPPLRRLRVVKPYRDGGGGAAS